MSDAMSDAYRMEREAEEKQKIHDELLKSSDDYKNLVGLITEQNQILKTTQKTIAVLTTQQREMLENYIK